MIMLMVMLSHAGSVTSTPFRDTSSYDGVWLGMSHYCNNCTRPAQDLIWRRLTGEHGAGLEDNPLNLVLHKRPAS